MGQAIAVRRDYTSGKLRRLAQENYVHRSPRLGHRRSIIVRIGISHHRERCAWPMSCLVKDTIRAMLG
jgi:hypothetical protein